MKRIDLPVAWLAAFLVLAWAQARFAPTPFPQPLGHDIGAFAILCAVLLLIAASVQFRRHRTTILPDGHASELITTGVFGKSRNPIYLAFVLVLAGASLWLGSILGLLLVPVLAAVLKRRFILPEEERLRATFGEAYERYAEETRRWL